MREPRKRWLRCLAALVLAGCLLSASVVSQAGSSGLKKIRKPYHRNGVHIVLYRGRYKSKAGGSAVYYAAHVVLSPKAYGKMHLAKAKGKRSAGFQTVREMVKSRKTGAYRAVLAVNGPFNGKDSRNWNAFGRRRYRITGHDYAEIYGGRYAAGKLGGKAVRSDATYSFATGLLRPGTEQKGVKPGMLMKQAAKAGLISDTFHGDMGGELLSGGQIRGKKRQKAYAQRTFIGTNGRAGDFWIVVSNGRYSDGRSKGLNAYGEGAVLKKLGCSYGYNLDGGGSSTMVYRGKTVNRQPMLRRCYDALYIHR